MSKKNFRPEYQAQLPKTDHDLNQRFIFTSSVGQILPVYHHPLNPGERITGSFDLFTRTQPLLTAAMADISEDIDVFFVPFPLLFTDFEARAYGTNDHLSSTFENANSEELPLLQLSFGNIEDYGDDTDDGGDSFYKSSYRLLTHLGYNPNSLLPDNYSVGENIYVNPFTTLSPNIFPYALLAYHAIYYKWFSNSDRERQIVSYYNWDKYFNNTYVSPGDTIPAGFLQLHYVPLTNDYFSSTLPTPIVSSANTLNSSRNFNAMIKNFLGANNTRGYDISGATTDFYDQIDATITSSHGQATSNLRAAFALEKYLRVLGRADKTYDAQVLAHLGVKVPHDVKHQITHLGHFHSDIHIGEVVSTASTEEDTLGDIAGKGYGKSESKETFDFTAPVHGVLMAVYYARPRVIYERYGFDKINAFTSFNDLWNDEFDQLGVQPLFGYETNIDSGMTNEQMTAICGFQFRYLERKRKYDKTTPAFFEPNRANRFNDWIRWINQREPLDGFALSQAVSGQIPHFSKFLCHPTDLNALFVQPYITNWSWQYVESPWLIFQSDPFIHDLRTYVKLYSPMSKTGEPKLDM